jgi:hypothetical protein
MGAVEPPSVTPEVDELILMVRGEVGWVCGTPRGVLVRWVGAGVDFGGWRVLSPQPAGQPVWLVPVAGGGVWRGGCVCAVGLRASGCVLRWGVVPVDLSVPAAGCGVL